MQQQMEQSLEAISKSWPKTAREALQTMIEKYGQPFELPQGNTGDPDIEIIK